MENKILIVIILMAFVGSLSFIKNQLKKEMREMMSLATYIQAISK
jgi:hypothetical protein